MFADILQDGGGRTVFELLRQVNENFTQRIANDMKQAATRKLQRRAKLGKLNECGNVGRTVLMKWMI